MRMTRQRPPIVDDASTSHGPGTRAATAAPVGTPALPARRVDDLSVHPGGDRLGELLVDAGLVTQPVLSEALVQQSTSEKRIGTLLVELGALDDRALARTLAQQLSLPYLDLRSDTPSPDAVALLPEATARSLGAVPMSLDGDEVVVAVAAPDVATGQALQAALGRPVRLAVATPADVNRAILNSYRAIASVDVHVQAFEVRESVRKAAAQSQGATVNDDAPVVRIVRLLITQGLLDRASDIHLEPQDDRVRVRYRIDGALHDVLSLPGAMGPAIASRIKIMGGMNIVERRKPQDGQIAIEIEGRDLDIRVSTTATIWGEKVVMRLLDKSRPLYHLGDLGMPTDTGERYSRLLRSPYGMVMCAGPTGSGKTTTLYGSLSEINSPDRNIMTIEDPVEYVFPSINQIQINEAAGVTFAGGLRSILRQDPDIVLVGEIRDVETARIAVQSALTGHFVLSSIHATDSVAALHRLLDMGIEAFLVSSSLTAVVAQRLVRRTCTSCRVAYTPSAEELAFLREVSPGFDERQDFTRGAGCNFCSQTGYLERIGVYELLVVTSAVKELVLDRAAHDDIRKVARSEGMRTLREEAVALVAADVTTPAEAMRSIYVAGA